METRVESLVFTVQMLIQCVSISFGFHHCMICNIIMKLIVKTLTHPAG